MDFTSSSGTTYGGRGGFLHQEFLPIVTRYLSVLTEEKISQFNTIKSSYIDTLSSSEAKIKAVDYSGWSDSVSSKLGSFSDELKNNEIVLIRNDVESGNLPLLISELKKLKGECDKYMKEYNRNIPIPNKLEGDEYDEYKSKLSIRRKNLDNFAKDIKSIVKKISSITFMGEVSTQEEYDSSSNNSNYLDNMSLIGGKYYYIDSFAYEINGVMGGGGMLINRETGDRIVYSNDGVFLYKTIEDNTYVLSLDFDGDFVNEDGTIPDYIDKILSENIDRINWAKPDDFLTLYTAEEVFSGDTVTILVDGVETNIHMLGSRTWSEDNATRALMEMFRENGMVR